MTSPCCVQVQSKRPLLLRLLQRNDIYIETSFAVHLLPQPSSCLLHLAKMLFAKPTILVLSCVSIALATPPKEGKSASPDRNKAVSSDTGKQPVASPRRLLMESPIVQKGVKELKLHQRLRWWKKEAQSSQLSGMVTDMKVNDEQHDSPVGSPSRKASSPK